MAQKFTYAVTLHVPWATQGGQEQGASPFEYYPNCTEVEHNGPVLCFRDADGIFTKTTAPWTVRKYPVKSDNQTEAS